MLQVHICIDILDQTIYYSVLTQACVVSAVPSIYRTRMAIADKGELIVLAPGGRWWGREIGGSGGVRSCVWAEVRLSAMRVCFTLCIIVPISTMFASEHFRGRQAHRRPHSEIRVPHHARDPQVLRGQQGVSARRAICVHASLGQSSTVSDVTKRFCQPRRTMLCLVDGRCCVWQDLMRNLSAAAHLIHGTSENRFSVTYCPGNLTQQEVATTLSFLDLLSCIYAAVYRASWHVHQPPVSLGSWPLF